jgi:hypothetical protein
MTIDALNAQEVQRQAAAAARAAQEKVAAQVAETQAKREALGQRQAEVARDVEVEFLLASMTSGPIRELSDKRESARVRFEADLVDQSVGVTGLFESFQAYKLATDVSVAVLGDANRALRGENGPYVMVATSPLDGWSFSDVLTRALELRIAPLVGPARHEHLNAAAVAGAAAAAKVK